MSIKQHPTYKMQVECAVGWCDQHIVDGTHYCGRHAKFAGKETDRELIY